MSKKKKTRLFPISGKVFEKLVSKKVLVQTRVPEDTFEKLTRLANVEGLSIAAYVRRMLMAIPEEVKRAR